MNTIDINADLGESFGPWKMGNDAQIMKTITSANVACGGHAGDPATMFDSISQALNNNVTIGAHPGFEDKLGFGRRKLPLTVTEIEYLVASQTGALCGMAALAGAEVCYVKAHGALGNWGADNADVAAAIVKATKSVLGNRATLLAISGTELEIAGHAAEIATYSEIFADRGYSIDGTLVPRSEPGAMIHDATEASARLIGFFESGKMPTVCGGSIQLKAQSICVHGDGPNAVAMAQQIRSDLEAAGLSIAGFANQ